MRDPVGRVSPATGCRFGDVQIRVTANHIQRADDIPQEGLATDRAPRPLAVHDHEPAGFRCGTNLERVANLGPKDAHIDLPPISFQRWRTAHRDRDFEETVQQLEHFKDLLPFSSRPYRRLGQVWLAKFEQSHDIEDARKSVAYFEGAVERYPHLAKLLAEWAIACEAAGLANTARDVAQRALRQDNINRQAGHSDKYLSPDLRSRMERLTGEIT